MSTGAAGSRTISAVEDRARHRLPALLLALVALVAATAAGPMASEASAASCGGLFQPPCTSGGAAYKACGGLLQPACPSGGTTRSTPCGGLLQPACPSGGTTRSTPCGGLLQPACPSGGTTRSTPCGGLLQPACPPAPQCRNGRDDDLDGDVDLQDLGCSSKEDNKELGELAPDANGNPVSGPIVDPATTGKLFGLNTYVSGHASAGLTVADEVALIRNAGANLQRVTLSWAYIQPRGTAPIESRLAHYDQLYSELRSQGMQPLITLIDAPTWATDDSWCGLLDFNCRNRASQQLARVPPADMPAYGRFVQFMARRYPHAAIETWNEPNIRQFWNDEVWPDTGRLARMQCAAYDAVRAIGSSQPVLAPGVSVVLGKGVAGQHYPYLAFMRSLHRKMGRRCWDALGIHHYPRSHVDGPGSSTAEALRIVRKVRGEFGDTTPIWITEAGASTTGRQGGDHGATERTPEEQRRMLGAMTNEMLATTDVAALVLHSLRDAPVATSPVHNDPANVDYGYGLLHNVVGPTLTPKLSYCHFVAAAGNTYPGC